MAIAEDLADKLAAQVVAHVERTGDEEIVKILASAIGESSQTLQDAFITSVRVQRAALRAERQLKERIARFEAAPRAKAGPPDGVA